jgi:hypothetical protein
MEYRYYDPGEEVRCVSGCKNAEPFVMLRGRGNEVYCRECWRLISKIPDVVRFAPFLIGRLIKMGDMYRDADGAIRAAPPCARDE